MSMAPTRQEVTFGLRVAVRIEDGKFVEQWGGSDTYGLLKELDEAISCPSD